MAWSIQGFGIVGLLMASLAGGAQPVGSIESESGIRVRIYDYVGVASGELRKIKKVAAGILEGARVDVVWLECRVSENEPVRDSRCESTLTPLDIHLRIVGPEMAAAAGTTEDSFGYAWLGGGPDIIAAVYYHRAVEMEKQNVASRWSVLGGIIAHEIGHLLLGEARHSASGIMLAVWGRRELKRISQGRLGFSADQIRRIRRSVTARAGRSGMGPVSEYGQTRRQTVHALRGRLSDRLCRRV